MAHARISRLREKIIEFLLGAKKITTAEDTSPEPGGVTWYSERAFDEFLEHYTNRQPTFQTEQFLGNVGFDLNKPLTEEDSDSVLSSNIQFLIEAAYDHMHGTAAKDRAVIAMAMVKLELVLQTTAIFRHIPVTDLFQIFLSFQLNSKFEEKAFLEAVEKYLAQWDTLIKEKHEEFQQTDSKIQPNSILKENGESNDKRTIN